MPCPSPDFHPDQLRPQQLGAGEGEAVMAMIVLSLGMSIILEQDSVM